MAPDLLERRQPKNQDIEYLKPTLSREDLKGVLECLAADNLSTGQIVEKFEKSFSSTFRFKFSLSVNSLTSAYHCALQTLGVGEGDRVLLSDLGSISALDAIFLLKAKPILVDVARNSFHMDPELFQSKLAEHNPKVVILDHSFGSLIDAKHYPVPEEVSILEDFSEAMGGMSETIAIGKQGKLSICGLQVENVITTGNGAMIVTSDSELNQKLRTMVFGRSKIRNLSEPKFDYNLIDYQAALGIEQLSKLGVLLERKKKIAHSYLQAVSNSRIETYFKNPSEDSFNRFPIVVTSGSYDEVKRYFDSIHIGTMRVIDEPLHAILEENKTDYPNTERLYQRGHCIPVYPNLTKDNVLRISNAIRRIY
ncbi:DegT/DnrJ/EryC1/StrS family aminotransferase [Leptospira sp. GIMC2001]|uniref:DegT/DnrJ/EryC1/StrS family aminotransferase n=1 Tax=Leptospira sp. GIMC2001 TaxID=1513297 RepID=UPI0023491807|nr:DegT/DnrJ/EryC1/StrS family aminotransferase [Leptospira sp. GIMC2001]WCL49891.1 DegT/DnrJ/EryC1/StrS family aminotransferase [Leptospira sp. GIMC2001]